MKVKILNDLNLKKNKCFNQVSQTDDTIHITKSRIKISSVLEIREICNIQAILAKYEKHSNITISLDEVIIKLN